MNTTTIRSKHKVNAIMIFVRALLLSCVTGVGIMFNDPLAVDGIIRITHESHHQSVGIINSIMLIKMDLVTISK